MKTLLRVLLASALCAAPLVASKEAKRPVTARAGRSPEAPSNYVQQHMASEHHIGAFDLPSFFQLHDLDRNGVLDRSEIEAIYGVHHSTSRKHSPNAEVHDQKADHIVNEVLRRLDKNGDGLVTRSEFLRGGTQGLPTFPEYGKSVLGHHYDEESEFFVHHEEKYHSKPEGQGADKYTHPEDLEHFAHHNAIEREEEERERFAEGMPSIEEDERREREARAQGKPYESRYTRQFQQDTLRREEDEQHLNRVGGAGREVLAEQHVFKTPEGPRRVVATDQNVMLSDGKLGDRDAPPVFVSGRGNVAGRAPEEFEGETELGRRIRLDRARREASGRPRFGQGSSGFSKPRNDADRLREGTPYKYRVSRKEFPRDM